MDKADRKEQQAGEQKQQVLAGCKADPILNLIPSRGKVLLQEDPSNPHETLSAALGEVGNVSDANQEKSTKTLKTAMGKRRRVDPAEAVDLLKAWLEQNRKHDYAAVP